MHLHGEPLRPHAASLIALLDDAVRRAPDRPFLVERRDAAGWRHATYATVAERSRRVGAALHALGASPERPVLILSANGIEHATVAFGAMRAGIPVAPVPPAAAASAGDGFAYLRAVAGAVRPAVVFAYDGGACADAVRAVLPAAVFVSVLRPRDGGSGHDYAALRAHAPLPGETPLPGGDAVAKILFVPGAEGAPKGVVTTHGMVCAMLQAVTQAWPFLEERPPVVVDWLPWYRAFGGNLVLGLVLRHAGTLYVDDGAPTGARFERTVRLRAEVSPSLAFDVPLGWARWAEQLRADDALRRSWLAGLDRACWFGAALAPATRDTLQAMKVPLVGSWGATEAASTATLTFDANPRHDGIGVPVAGVELKLAPSGGRVEARLRGPQLTPGYWWRPDLTASAFDEDGFFRSGDAVRLVNGRAPARGLVFVERVDERFKLSSGTWVQRAEVRDALLAECSDLQDAIVTGDGRDEVGVVAWPTADGARLDAGVLRLQVTAAMERAGRGKPVGSRPRRALIVERAPRAHELAATVARVHASEPDADVIVT